MSYLIKIEWGINGPNLKFDFLALAGVAQWIERWTAN